MKKITLSMLTCIALLLSGCSTHKGIYTELNIRTASYLNPDTKGNPAPVVVTVYELRSEKYFTQASFDNLESHPMDTLKSSLIDLHNFEIRPNENTKQEIYLNTDSSYIGLTAAYRNIDTAEWKKIIPVNSRKKVTLAVELESDNLQAHIEK